MKNDNWDSGDTDASLLKEKQLKMPEDQPLIRGSLSKKWREDFYCKASRHHHDKGKETLAFHYELSDNKKVSLASKISINFTAN